MRSVGLSLLLIATLWAYRHHRIGTLAAGSSNVIDRDADRIIHQLRAIHCVREAH